MSAQVMQASTKGFGWWKAYGALNLILGTLLCLTTIATIGVGVGLALTAVNITMSIFILKYSRTAMIISTVLSCNPVLWVIHWIYIGNRWDDPLLMENARAIDAAPASTAITSSASPVTSQAVPGDAVALPPASDEDFWSAAMAEAESAQRRPGLWAKCFSEAAGNEAAAKAAYIAARVVELRDADQQQRKHAALEARRQTMNAEQRAYDLLPKGHCPNCEVIIPLASEKCPMCKAEFGPGSAWSIKPV